MVSVGGLLLHLVDNRSFPSRLPPPTCHLLARPRPPRLPILSISLSPLSPHIFHCPQPARHRKPEAHSLPPHLSTAHPGLPRRQQHGRGGAPDLLLPHCHSEPLCRTPCPPQCRGGYAGCRRLASPRRCRDADDLLAVATLLESGMITPPHAPSGPWHEGAQQRHSCKLLVLGVHPAPWFSLLAALDAHPRTPSLPSPPDGSTLCNQSRMFTL